MINLVTKALRTFRREGIQSVKRKTINRYNAWKLTQKTDIKTQEARWNTIKGKYAGKRAFLIGNGPSLNSTPLYLLKDEYKMCFNRFHIMMERLNWQPDFFVTSDNLVLSDLIHEFDEIIPKTTYSFFPGIHFRGHNFIHEVEKFDNAYWTIQLMGKGFSSNLPKIFPGGSVIYEGFQILKYLGFKEIYLLGVDMDYKVHTTAKMLEKKGIDIISQDDDDPNHFDPRYFGKNRKYHQPEKFVIDNTIKDLDFIAQNIMDDNFRIINVGYNSKLESFPKDDFIKILDQTEENGTKLFDSLLEETSKREGLKLSREKFPALNNKLSFNNHPDSFCCELTIALKLMNKAVFTHIPVGPFENKYYFIKRKTS